MNHTHHAAVAAAAFAAATFPGASALAAPVLVDLSPANQVVGVGDIVEVQLIVAADGLTPQGFDALDAILTWDTAYLNLMAIDDSDAGATFVLSAFLPDPDGINASVNDGDALYTAWAPAGSPVSAPPTPGSLIVTTFQFQALAPTIGTDVILIPQMGVFGKTRVLLEGAEVTGDILGPATITIIPAPGALMMLGIAGLCTRRRRRR